MKKENARSYLRFIRFTGVPGQEWPNKPFTKSEIRIGRPDTQRHADDPDLNLEPDWWASRSHARIINEGGKLFIEDLMSKRGTFINGQNIKGQGPVELIPGSSVQTGETIWTVFPSEWLFIQRGNIIIYGPCARSINYALYQCGLPVVGRLKSENAAMLTARNVGDRRSHPFSINIEVIEYSAPYDITIPAIDPGEIVPLEIPNIHLYQDILRKKNVLGKTRLCVKIDGVQNFETAKLINILGYWDWSCEPSARKTIAAFIFPRNNKIIEHIVLDAQEKLKDTAAGDSFSILLRSGHVDAERLILKALYQYLKENWCIDYESPQCGIETSHTYQTIRPPERIFPSYLPNLSDRKGIATCLDLTLLIAGCLEHIGLHPLVIFTGNEKEVPTHALIGCWVGKTHGERPVINDMDLRCKVKTEHILVVESTGIAKGVTNHTDKLSFTLAVEDALQQLEDTEWVCAVDIAFLRSSIKPMEPPVEPEVAIAYDCAKQFARSRRLGYIETTHLFCGLLTAGGGVMQWLFKEAHLEAPEAYLKRLKGIEKTVRASYDSKDLKLTPNFRACQKLAEDYSLYSGVRYVREQDLLWALLNTSRLSQKLPFIFRQLGIDCDKLKSILGERYPEPNVLIAPPTPYREPPPPSKKLHD